MPMKRLFAIPPIALCLLSLYSSPLLAQSCAEPPEGLVSLWRAEDDANDFTSRNPGTIQGELEFIDGKFDRAFRFRSVGHIEMPISSSLRRLVTGITIAAWVRPDFTGRPRDGVTGDSDTIVHARAPGFAFHIIMDPNENRFCGAFGRTVPAGALQFAADPNCQGAVSRIGIANDGRFHHVAATYDKVALRVYLDGREAGVQSFAGSEIQLSTDPAALFRIGPGSLCDIDEIAIFDRALSLDEIAALSRATTPFCGTTFLRGDCNGDGAFSGIADAVFHLRSNFLGGGPPPCNAACDANSDGNTGGVVDAIYMLTHAFRGGPPPSPPFPNCGASPLDSDTVLGCAQPPDSCS